MIFKFIGFLLTGHVMLLDISIDFDGTIIKDGYFPEIGPLRLGAKYWINWMARRGHYLILNTCRCNHYKNPAYNFALGKAYMFLQYTHLHFELVNQNKQKAVDYFGADPRKLSVDLNIDDKSLIPWSWWMVPFFVLLAEYKKFKQVNRCQRN
jgi:hypothetical protein